MKILHQALFLYTGLLVTGNMEFAKESRNIYRHHIITGIYFSRSKQNYYFIPENVFLNKERNIKPH